MEHLEKWPSEWNCSLHWDVVQHFDVCLRIVIRSVRSKAHVTYQNVEHSGDLDKYFFVSPFPRCAGTSEWLFWTLGRCRKKESKEKKKETKLLDENKVSTYQTWNLHGFLQRDVAMVIGVGDKLFTDVVDVEAETLSRLPFRTWTSVEVWPNPTFRISKPVDTVTFFRWLLHLCDRIKTLPVATSCLRQQRACFVRKCNEA